MGNRLMSLFDGLDLTIQHQVIHFLRSSRLLFYGLASAMATLPVIERIFKIYGLQVLVIPSRFGVQLAGCLMIDFLSFFLLCFVFMK